MNNKPKTIIVMKVGPHSNMSLDDIIISKQEEQEKHNMHFWGYSGVFCQPKATQKFCKMSFEKYGEYPKLILIETKSPYKSSIGLITQYSSDGKSFFKFKYPVQLQGAQFSFVAKDLTIRDNFYLDDYVVVEGKNDGKPLSQHLRFRVNKCFAELTESSEESSNSNKHPIKVLEAQLVNPFSIWLKE